MNQVNGHCTLSKRKGKLFPLLYHFISEEENEILICKIRKKEREKEKGNWDRKNENGEKKGKK